MSAIELEGVSLRYGSVLAVDDLTFDVPEGKIFGFLGPNGAGKTSTIKILTTLLPPKSGKARVFGFSVQTDGEKIRPKIGLVQQQPSYEPRMSVRAQMELYGYLWGLSRTERKRKTKALVEEFGLSGLEDRLAIDLSIGERRRLQVAREFLHDPDLLFLDEPTAGLDPLGKTRVHALLRKKISEGMTIFLTTHDLSEAEAICDSVGVLNHGRLRAIGTPKEIMRKFGGLKTVLVETERSPREVALVVAPLVPEELAHSMSVNEEGSEIEFVLPSDPKLLAALLEALARNANLVRDITIRSATLEEAFIRMLSGQGERS